MKKTLIIAFGLFVSMCSAQQDIYKKVSAFIKQNDPDLVIENKVLVINFTNADIKGDKSVYNSLEKTANVYSHAKLKGGRNGVICVTIVDDTQAEVALNKQGYKNIHVVTKSRLDNLDASGIENITFDAMGEVVFKNLEPSKIYEAINTLITR